MTSIGRRCKRGDALSRAVLIAREAFPLFPRRGFCRAWAARRREAPSGAEPPAFHFSPLSRCQDFEISAVTDGGSYPFPFRTRKSSLLSPMVPGPRARESRSPPDPRAPVPTDGGPPLFKRRRGKVPLPGRGAAALCRPGTRGPAPLPRANASFRFQRAWASVRVVCDKAPAPFAC